MSMCRQDMIVGAKKNLIKKGKEQNRQTIRRVRLRHDLSNKTTKIWLREDKKQDGKEREDLMWLIGDEIEKV